STSALIDAPLSPIFLSLTHPPPPPSPLFPYTTLFRSSHPTAAHSQQRPRPEQGRVQRRQRQQVPRHRRRPSRLPLRHRPRRLQLDPKSTRLNSSHVETSYAIFSLKHKHHHQDQLRDPV